MNHFAKMKDEPGVYPQSRSCERFATLKSSGQPTDRALWKKVTSKAGVCSPPVGKRKRWILEDCIYFVFTDIVNPDVDFDYGRTPLAPVSIHA
tara:strand:+ start:13596 stop:13874 length:279 start_codon:yes stop_codon:yes gene_type:complete